jgi:hypothetical protein
MWMDGLIGCGESGGGGMDGFIIASKWRLGHVVGLFFEIVKKMARRWFDKDFEGINGSR